MSSPSSLTDVLFLQSDVAQYALESLMAQAITETNTLQHLTRLRKQFESHQAGLLLTQAQLRNRATAKFGANAHHMLFDAQALEQASHPLVRDYRTQLIIAQYHPQTLLDAGCGMGADTQAFASNINDVSAFDLDPIRIALAQYNAHQSHQTITYAVADIRQPLPQRYDVIFFDPARRTETGQRIFDVEQYHPPLSLVRSWQASCPTTQIVVKLAPGVQDDQLAGYGGILEFISVSGELKEAVLWLDQTSRLQRRATVLLPDQPDHPNQRVHHLHFSEFAPDDSLPPELTEPRQWLIEPDPSVIRASLVRELGQVIHASQLHEEIAYLTADAPSATPFARSWRIRTWQPYHIKQLRRYLRANHIGRVTVKKRGMDIKPESFIKDLKLNGRGDSCTLVLTRMQSQRIIIICDDIHVE